VKVSGPERDRLLLEWLVEVFQGRHLAEVTGLKNGCKVEIDFLWVEAFELTHEISEAPLGFVIGEKPERRLDTQLLQDLGVPTQF